MVDLRSIVDGNQEFPRALFVHMSKAENAKDFFGQRWPEARALGDPQQTFYRAFAVKNGSPVQFVKPGFWKAAWNAKSHGVGAPQGNTFRNPGVFLIRDTEIVFSQEPDNFGMQVDADRVMQALSGD